MRTTTHDDIMARIKTEGDCVVYVGSRTKEGYGYFWTLGQYWRAHRYFYSYFVGAIPEGKLIRHTSDNDGKRAV